MYLRDCTAVKAYPLLLFSGTLQLVHTGGGYVFVLDKGWIRFSTTSYRLASLIKEVGAVVHTYSDGQTGPIPLRTEAVTA